MPDLFSVTWYVDKNTNKSGNKTGLITPCRNFPAVTSKLLGVEADQTREVNHYEFSSTLCIRCNNILLSSILFTRVSEPEYEIQASQEHK